MDAYGVEATSETQKWRRRDPEIDPKEKEQCSFGFFFQWQCMNGKGDRLMKRPPWSPCPYRQFSLYVTEYIRWIQVRNGSPRSTYLT
eukprot:jgi/Picsp_1/4509/NSC_06730-R1_---NA---